MSAFLCIEKSDLSGLKAALRSVDIDVVNVAGETLLHAAAGKNGSLVIAQELIRRGINVNAPDEDGATPLLFAVVWKRRDVVEAIVNAGGRLDITDAHGNQPLWYAVGNPRPDLELISYLIRMGADPNHRNEFGRSPLSIAKERELDQIVRILEERNKEDKSGRG